MPNKIKDKFKYISKNLEALKSKKFYLEDNLKKIIYLTNKEMAKNILLFGKCENNKTKHINLEKLLDYINSLMVQSISASTGGCPLAASSLADSVIFFCKRVTSRTCLIKTPSSFSDPLISPSKSIVLRLILN